MRSQALAASHPGSWEVQLDLHLEAFFAPDQRAVVDAGDLGDGAGGVLGLVEVEVLVVDQQALRAGVDRLPGAAERGGLGGTEGLGLIGLEAGATP